MSRRRRVVDGWPDRPRGLRALLLDLLGRWRSHRWRVRTGWTHAARGQQRQLATIAALRRAAAVEAERRAAYMEARRLTVALYPRPALNFPRRPASLSDR